MADILLQKFFEKERWEQALETGVDKGIDKGELRKLTTPEVRVALYNAIVSDNYEIAPPHQAAIPKDNGDMRIVYVNENIDRIFLSIVNNMFFEMFQEFVHPACKSYQSGIGCGKIVQEVSKWVVNTNRREVGFKADLTKNEYVVGIRPEYFIISNNPLFKAKIESNELIGKDCILNFTINGIHSKSITDIGQSDCESKELGFDIEYNNIYLFEEEGARVY